MDDIILHFLAEQLIRDVNIEKEHINLGKTIWSDYELEDLGEDIVFVNLYAEISLDELKRFAFKIDAGMHYVIDGIKDMLEQDPVLLIKYCFAKEKTLKDYDALIEKNDDLDIHVELSPKDHNLIVDINLMAKIVGGNNE
jgi:hypothetical protein